MCNLAIEKEGTTTRENKEIEPVIEIDTDLLAGVHQVTDVTISM